MDDEREWPHKFEFLERLPECTHARAGEVFDSLLWTVGEAPCAALKWARAALAVPDCPDLTSARLGIESALRTVHSGGDLLAQLVDVCLFSPPLPERQVAMNHKKFIDRLDGAAPSLARSFDEFRSGGGSWAYVEDVTNSLKHRLTLPVKASLDGDLAVLAFQFRGRRHAERSFGTISEAVINVQSGLWDLSWLLYEELR